MEQEARALLRASLTVERFMLTKEQGPVPSSAHRTAFTALLAATSFLSQPATALPIAGPPAIGTGFLTIQTEGAVGSSALDELNRVLEEARSKLDQLAGAADLAAHVSSLREQLEQTQRQNRRLHEQVGEVENLRRELADREERLKEIDDVETTLQAAVRRSEEKAARLKADLDATRSDLDVSEQARKAAEDRLTDMQTVARSALSEAAEAGRTLVEMKERLAAKEKAIASAEEAKRRTERGLAATRAKAEDLEEELAQVRLALDERVDENERLTKQVASFESAATSARDTARANLEAVESKIATLNSLMAGMMPPPQTSAEMAVDGNEEKGNGKTAAGTSGADVVSRELAPFRSANATESPDLAALKKSEPASQRRPRTLAEAVRDLPLEKRVQAQSLLADLKAETREDGVLMRVPGEELFALDSEKIEPTAHDTLAKVAELISVFEDREVEITGHTDALGDAVYNQGLSQRRAELVKRFFVDNYEVDDARLNVAGLGERAPIATNTTRQGRQANRRVEVMIRN
jgi:outer membrane protein OmpA-like peptidoglycan-associated protein